MANFGGRGRVEASKTSTGVFSVKEKIAMLEPHIHRLTKRAAEEGLCITVVIKPVLCTLDERTAMFESLMGAALGSLADTAIAPQALADPDSPVDDLVARVEKLEARKCRCAAQSVTC